jgi:outer membrane lipoprotein-sorting protein
VIAFAGLFDPDRSDRARTLPFGGGSRSGLTVVCWLIVLSSFVPSCGVSRTRVVPAEELRFPSMVATRGDLLEELEQASNAVRTLTATVNLTASAGALTTGQETIYRETRGFLVVERPSRIRMRGEAPLALVTVFDMVSDGETFQVSVPVQNKVVVGDTKATTVSENAILNLRPQHIMDALFVDVNAYVNSASVLPIFYEAVDGQRSFYIFEFVGSDGREPRVLEKLWIDRRDLRVSRKQIFGNAGVVETDVAYGLYEEIEGISFPHNILIERPVEDYSLTIEFNRAELNSEIEASAFLFSAPPGAELIDMRQTASDQLD